MHVQGGQRHRAVAKSGQYTQDQEDTSEEWNRQEGSEHKSERYTKNGVDYNETGDYANTGPKGTLEFSNQSWTAT